MPNLRILTNVPKNQIPEDFCNKIIPVLVRTVRKSAEKFSCVICGDCQVGFGGDNTAPGAVATLESIGHVGPEENKLVVKELSAFMQKEIGVNPDRFFISFYDVHGSNIGRGGITHA
ncbi:macrophage migration inhibitory factor-like isoform X2 [Plodia interpunctella]|uniref:macrophage migration inhibitory factor-like isoform X2 n=1 Tax=Plodia interpunctella TaxID=58824 RepID=UPI0023683DAA|nr:macrophage migration inhibitory factor-like isoform X2 [Plodia interpunctella]